MAGGSQVHLGVVLLTSTCLQVVLAADEPRKAKFCLANTARGPGSQPTPILTPLCFPGTALACILLTVMVYN